MSRLTGSFPYCETLLKRQNQMFAQDLLEDHRFCLISTNRATLKWKYTDVTLYLHGQEVTQTHSRFQTDFLLKNNKRKSAF